jgi:hypothetical protein
VSNEIKANDLVRVAYPTPCCSTLSRHHKRVFYVGGLWQRPALECKHCGAPHLRLPGAYEVGDREEWFPLSMLKKIDPPALNDEVEHDEAVTV